ncbi:Hypothetical protein R9X50_00048700 [Acrodontium crateriforme]|uniref:C2H2-type domain-containing protein n=1 Tax=Acrodontium crateriforme TaxID=150365 RepID=A0AAQ3M3A8_9PEZI|nr:Hypothetical protein R9X50_00048700 [Acrodontium crateriforme]
MAAIAMGGYRPYEGLQSYPQHYAMYQSKPFPAHPTPETLLPRPTTSYHDSNRSAQPPQMSPNAKDASKPSLPSISNLIGIADRDVHNQAYARHQPPRRLSPTQRVQDERRPFPYSSPGYQRPGIPPSPALSHENPGERRSPSLPTGSAPYLATSVFDANDRPLTRTTSLSNPQSIHSQSTSGTAYSASYTTSPYATSPSATSNHSMYSSSDSSYPYNQQPLPSSFPPTTGPISVQQPHHSHPPPQTQKLPSLSQPNAPNPWEHHHYISPTASNAFSQSQDRYICPTCNKAFSRPSSLKIHSHSHTGEKPFKCPQNGCGKAFSVRSNMKRHERGCHAGLPGGPDLGML